MKTFSVVAVIVAVLAAASASYSENPKLPSIKMKRVTDSKTKATKAAISTYTLFDYNQTAAVLAGAAMMPRPGCWCEPDQSQPNSQDIPVSPEFGVQAHVGQPVELRYDASIICHRQSIWDMSGKVHKPVDQLGDLTVGTVQWEIGSVWALPLEWGIVTYSGYTQVGTQQVTFNIKLQCHDDFKNCTHTCIKKKTINVTVLP